MDASEADRAQLPSWYDGVGSFRKDVVLGHVKDIPDVAERIVVKDVPTVTFDELCERHSVAQVDLILIDTEGYDWEIIRHIDLRNWSPTLLVYEHFHLSREARSDSLEHLAGLGYEFLEEGFDTFCLGPRADRRLRRTWRRLRPAYPGVSAYDEER
jgi:hypothetical protein